MRYFNIYINIKKCIINKQDQYQEKKEKLTKEILITDL